MSIVSRLLAEAEGFQRRHYEAVANTLAQHAGKPYHAALVGDFSRMFGADNPRFQPDRFRDASTSGGVRRSRSPTAGFSRRHLEAIAGTLGRHAGKPYHADVVRDFSRMLGGDNPRFQPERFGAAASRS